MARFTCRHLGRLVATALLVCSVATKDANAQQLVARSNVLTPPDSVDQILRHFSAPVTLALAGGRRVVFDPSQGVVTLWAPNMATPLFAQTVGGPRLGASAVALPNGNILIWGGISGNGELVQSGEWFDPVTGQLHPAIGTGLPPMAGQQMVVLPDGNVLVAGGWQSGASTTTESAIWNPQTASFRRLPVRVPAQWLGARSWISNAGVAVFPLDVTSAGETGALEAVYNPALRQWSIALATDPTLRNMTTLQVVMTRPASGSIAVPVSTRIALLFSRPIDPASLTAKTISFLGPGGFVPATLAPTDGGRLIFLNPDTQLYPGSRYTGFVQGVRTPHGRVVGFTTFSFTTQTLGTASAPTLPASPTSAVVATGNSTPNGSALTQRASQSAT